eukprot:scaffold46438_cov29-Tisochrysis_lutea.AAC.2
MHLFLLSSLLASSASWAAQRPVGVVAAGARSLPAFRMAVPSPSKPVDSMSLSPSSSLLNAEAPPRVNRLTRASLAHSLARTKSARTTSSPRMVAPPPSKPFEPMFLSAPSNSAPALAWEVHKFGGASLATAELYVQCAELLVSESMRPCAESGACAPTMAIVSARGGVTDKLINIVETSKKDLDEANRLLEVVASEQIEVAKAIASSEAAAEVARLIKADVRSISSALQAFALLKSVPAAALEVVSGYGEVWSAITMESYLSSQGHPATWLDARDVLIVQTTGEGGLGDKGSTNVMGTDPLWAPSEVKLAEWFNEEARKPLRDIDLASKAPIIIVTGFVASTADGVPTTLKRSGSDYSATIFARLMKVQ